MPMYVYQCPKCGKQEEVPRRVEDRDEPLLCPMQHTPNITDTSTQQTLIPMFRVEYPGCALKPPEWF